MNRGAFVIDERYYVYLALNQVQDKKTGHNVRLEPRIMAVLEQLSRSANQLVTREELINDVWNNYGGGDDGLSQAISFLRKILSDHDKKLIQTIPKKGYRLASTVSIYELQEAASRPRTTKLALRSFLQFIVLLYVLGTAAYFINASFHQEPLMANHSASLVAGLKPGSLPVAAYHLTKKFPPLRSNRKVTSITTNLKGPGTIGIKVLPIFAYDPTPILAACIETKFYHLRDTTARTITALDYHVTTTLQVSTTIE